jgi:D-alanyl-D-alanine carboxypeptidase
MRFGRLLFISLIAAAVALSPGFSDDAHAKSKSKSSKATSSHHSKSSSKSKKKSSSRHVREEDRFSALVVDADTGQVLYERNAGSVRYPASLTKMMTLYLTFEALKHETITLDQEFNVSSKAARQPQTNIFLDPGDRLTVRSAIESVVVRSANDSAMVLAEGIGGTEWNFALMMTKKAHELGMKNTVFRNPSGLPDNKQHTTAYDMARLGIALKRDFPEYYSFFSMQSFTHNGIIYPGHNRVMERYAGADGIKTGFIRASGYNLVTSASRDGHRVVAVIMGGNTATSRDNQMISLLDRTFARLANGDKESMADQRSEIGPKSATLEGHQQFIFAGNPG